MTNEQVLEQLCEFMNRDDNVRVLVLNGSLANPNVDRDDYQDVDVSCFVRDMYAFLRDSSWIDHFGVVLLQQRPDEVQEHTSYNRYAYLVQYEAGHRIDLTVRPLCDLETALRADSLSLVLLDKDEIAGQPISSDETYRVKRPNSFDYEQCWNEFWWVSLYVIKGLRRKQILYALDHLTIMRSMWKQMMAWNVGFATDFTVNIGKSGDGLHHYVQSEEWEAYLQSYKAHDTVSIEAAFQTMTHHFEQVSRRVAICAGFDDRAEEVQQLRAAYSTLWYSND
ncbi:MULTISPECIES: aminoglycoside 6-adenylyltransferase [Exiguobacterium]|uniref:aminoglycoside 6-adenylyltransferase n=1 Tax=Exiguobacterium TaxID=33986 RepID=UPI001BE92FDB|nr:MULTISPECIES: aminoglycoside 6-adenylyltransferase [Exiguobacterium]MCT4783942.1 aminoglycoside 6-adenylyltransferase [Exiguobacterium himgiriensis]